MKLNYSIFQQFPEILCKSLWFHQPHFGTTDAETPWFQHYKYLYDLAAVPPEKLAMAEQLHGAGISFTAKAGRFTDSDALVSQSGNLFLSIRTADCAAIMIYVPSVKVIANIHSGWRGSAQHILPQSIQKIAEKYACNPADFYVAVSPFIKKCCYRVGPELLDEFDRRYFGFSGDSIYLDLKKVLLDQLRSSGVPRQNIEFNDACTHCDQRLLPSFRRNKTNNRMLHLIKILENHGH